MDIDSFKRLFSLFLAALSIFALIFIIVSIFMVSRIAQDKRRKQEIKKDYANERLTPAVSPIKLP